MTTLFTIPNRTIKNVSTPREALPVSKISDVEDHLTKLVEYQKPYDRRISLDRIHVDFSNGVMTAKIIEPNGATEELLFTANGASQLASHILPGHFFRNMKATIALDKAGQVQKGAILMANTWMLWADEAVGKPKLVRFMTTNAGPQFGARKVIRSVHGPDYAAYANLQFVRDIRANAPELGNMPVLSWTISDNVMRIRFLAGEIDPNNLGEPVPMIEAWNSEVGRRRVVLRGGIWRPKTATALGHWTESFDHEWRHYGNPERIRQGVQGAFEKVRLATSRVLEAYQIAREIAIEDIASWMDERLQAAGLPTSAISASKKALTDPGVTPGNVLATAIDAIGVAASEEIDVEVQYEIELAAARALFYGVEHNKQSKKDDDTEEEPTVEAADLDVAPDVEPVSAANSGDAEVEELVDLLKNF